MKRLLVLCLAALLLVGCADAKTEDLDVYIQYLGQDRDQVMDALGEKEVALLQITEDEYAAVEPLVYEGIDFDVRFGFDEDLMVCTMEYIGTESDEIHQAIMKLYKTLAESYGAQVTEFPNWNTFWKRLENSVINSGVDDYGYYRMVGALWIEEHCEFWIKVYEGEGRIRIRLRYYVSEEWDTTYGYVDRPLEITEM